MKKKTQFIGLFLKYVFSFFCRINNFYLIYSILIYLFLLNLFVLKVKDETKRTTIVAKLFPEKNRTPDCIPYDHARVLLPTTTDDYINAVYVRVNDFFLLFFKFNFYLGLFLKFNLLFNGSLIRIRKWYVVFIISFFIYLLIHLRTECMFIFTQTAKTQNRRKDRHFLHVLFPRHVWVFFGDGALVLCKDFFSENHRSSLAQTFPVLAMFVKTLFLYKKAFTAVFF